jgi:hypothetical protein
MRRYTSEIHGYPVYLDRFPRCTHVSGTHILDIRPLAWYEVKKRRYEMLGETHASM